MFAFLPGFLKRLCLVFALLTVSARPGVSQIVTPFVVQMPSERPSGDARNDVIWVTFFPARAGTPSPAPAVILAHPLNAAGFIDTFMRRVAQDFAARGIGAAYLTLPYHKERLTPGDTPLRHFVGPNVETDADALAQSASDVRTVYAWLGRQSFVDAKRRGVVGGSLGAIVINLAMGQDETIAAGVSIFGGGDLPALYENSLIVKLFARPGSPRTPQALARLNPVEPLAFASRNRPRHVLMLGAARDLYVPPANVEILWKALGKPPIQWVDGNHFLALAYDKTMVNAAVAYFNRVWNGQADGDFTLPAIRIPTLKLGLLFGLDSTVTPALQWQAHSFASRSDHRSLAHFDLGLSGRGPFAAVGVTVNSFVDVGAAVRLGGRAPRPYLSLHFVP